MTARADPDIIMGRAAAVRQALERGAGAGCVSFDDFPRGACGDASILLGQMLHDSGLGTWTYRSGTLGGKCFVTHGWIERRGWIVDITADQFDAIDEAVIVTQDRTWHDRFRPIAGDGHSALLGPHDQLERVYERLLLAIDGPTG